ncbi:MULTISPECIES: thioredoxin [Chloracidobacterium]|jgi:thioredoxin 1|uniref:Thioredoxin n=1 Tax=Chloracidobacterium thermophilum (strain B) TaxID=981222 RepID=G2LDW7_CHLTF|nr:MULTISPECIES: thioredoxin [Chloracidobacterium]AEP10798.1 thioredoxin [Chloracidobacterium thermophilum B]QUV78731.1 thioredoxin [Chloracidobacterium thermophilum]QUV81781.1 thioredoxin [Chloracidobacterium sp. D]
MGGNVIEITDSNFEREVLQSDRPVLVDFWAAWCAPCRMLAPTVEALANDYAGRVRVGKLNVDENNQTSARFGIRGIPTLIVFKNGQEQERLTGAHPKDTIARMLEKHL